MSESSSPNFDVLSQRIFDRCESLLATASEVFDQELVCPEISINLRGQAAGQMRYRRVVKSSWRKNTPIMLADVQLRFNKQLLLRYQGDFIDQTVPHEVAHFVAYSVFGMNIKPHGKEWKYVMRDVFDADPMVRHSYEVERKSRPAFAYQCACPETLHQLGQIRHRRIEQDQAKYLCRKCKTALKPAESFRR